MKLESGHPTDMNNNNNICAHVSQVVLSSGFTTTLPSELHVPSIWCPWLEHHHNIWWRLHMMKFLIVQHFTASSYVISLRSKYILLVTLVYSEISYLQSAFLYSCETSRFIEYNIIWICEQVIDIDLVSSFDDSTRMYTSSVGKETKTLLCTVVSCNEREWSDILNQHLRLWSLSHCFSVVKIGLQQFSWTTDTWDIR
jgi:hypothetical protein